MTKSIENCCDTYIESMIPWYVTHQLCEEDRVKVELHIDDCDDCAKIVREETNIAALIQGHRSSDIPSNWKIFQRQLTNSDAVHADSLKLDEHNDIAQFPGNIIHLPVINRMKTAISNPKTLRYIIAAQAAALIAIITIPNQVSFADANSEDNQIYDTLSSGEAVSDKDANTIVQFDPNLSLRDFNNLLNSHKIQIISGPTPTNAYIVKIPNDIKLESLRNDKNILIAEPISAE